MNQFTKITVGFIATTLLTSGSLATNLIAQEGATDRSSDRRNGLRAAPEAAKQGQAAAHIALDKMMSAKVAFAPGMEAKREASEDGKTIERPTGSIDEFLVQCETGKLCGIVVSFGGLLDNGDNTVALPANALKWNAAANRYDVLITEKSVSSMANFNIDKARKTGFDVSLMSLEKSWKRLGLTSGNTDEIIGAAKKGLDDAKKGMKKGQKGLKDAAEAAGIAESSADDAMAKPKSKQHSIVCASEMIAYPVYAQTTAFGEIKHAFVDTKNHKITCVAIEHDGKTDTTDGMFVVPYGALQVKKMDDKDEPKLVVDKSVRAMTAGPKVHEIKDGMLPASIMSQVQTTYGEMTESGDGNRHEEAAGEHVKAGKERVKRDRRHEDG